MKDNWYENWFGNEYLTVYAHRDENEAEKLVQLILTNINLDKNSKIIDLCCGQGRHAHLFAREGFEVYGFDLSLGAQITIIFTALLASIGAASVPMSGMVMMSIILKAVGLPLEGVAIILAVDRILDMFRTTVNVLSDSCGSVIVARLEGESLKGIGEPVQ